MRLLNYSTQEAFLKSFFAHSDELYPKPQIKDDDSPTKKKISIISEDAKWNKARDFWWLFFEIRF